MRLLSVFVLVLLFAVPARADVITPGTWSPATPGAFYDGLSWDCPTCGVGFLLAGYPNLEYLSLAGNPTSFQVPGGIEDVTLLYQITAWTDGVFGYNAETGVFGYDSGTGRVSNSATVYWQYAWFRSTVDTNVTYFGGIEDILWGDPFGEDRDYNDYVFSFTLPIEEQIAPVPVPEPSSLVLLGLGLLAVRRRK